MQTLLLIAVITVFGAALRLCFLENTTLWFDERVSWELAAGSWKHFGTKYLNGKQICFSAIFCSAYGFIWAKVNGSNEVSLSFSASQRFLPFTSLGCACSS
jgi:hypothetical protein